jgi:hypothetical protein
MYGSVRDGRGPFNRRGNSGNKGSAGDGAARDRNPLIVVETRYGASRAQSRRSMRARRRSEMAMS